MTTSARELAEEVPDSPDGDVSHANFVVGDDACAQTASVGNCLPLNDCDECEDGCDRCQATKPGSNRARRQARVSPDIQTSDKGLFYVPYRAVSTSPIPSSLGFATAESVRHTAQSAAQMSEAVGDEPFGMVIGPGVVRLVTGKQATEANVSFSTRNLSPDSKSVVVPKLKHSEPRPEITGWSQKSRSRMIRVFAELDYAPLMDSERLPAMITLTYPGDWLTVAPSADAVKRVHFKAFAKRWQRTWGESLRCVWKLEFQRRGAPHLHLFTVPPHGSTTSRLNEWDGLEFAAWLSRTWADIVNHPDPIQRHRHESAGTAIDYANAITARDPKRLAMYFAKHAAPSLMSSKEYQHRVPREWIENGNKPGRFWGVLGLHKATADIALTEAEFIIVRRTLRRWSRHRAYYRPGERYPSSVVPNTRVQRIPVVDRATGVIRRSRTVRRRASYLDQGRLTGGYVLANQAPLLAVSVVEILRMAPADGSRTRS